MSQFFTRFGNESDALSAQVWIHGKLSELWRGSVHVAVLENGNELDDTIVSKNEKKVNKGDL